MKEQAYDRFDLDELLHPARAFSHPSEVVADPDLTLNEKRAILASWASDACALEAAPELRVGPKDPVRFDDVMDALRQLDQESEQAKAHYRRFVVRKWRRSGLYRRRDGDSGRSLQ